MTSIFQILTLAWSLQGNILSGSNTDTLMQSSQADSTMLSLVYGFRLQMPIFTAKKGDRDGVYFGMEATDLVFNKADMALLDSGDDVIQASVGISWGGMTLGLDHAYHHTRGALKGVTPSDSIKAFLKVEGSL